MNIRRKTIFALVHALSFGWLKIANSKSEFDAYQTPESMSKNKILLEAKIYRISDFKIETVLNVNNGCQLCGEGIDRTIIEINESNSINQAITIAGSNVLISDLTIRFLGKNKNKIGLLFNGICENIRLLRVKIDGDRAVDIDQRPHGILVHDNSIVKNVKIEDCIFSHLRYGIFTTNNFYGKAENWSIYRCEFFRNCADDIELNSLNNLEKPWRFILIQGCRFHDWIGDLSNRNSGFAIGLDSVHSVTISNNFFSGYDREAIHVEDYLSGVLINSNQIENCESGIVVFFEKSSDILIVNNIISGRYPAPVKDKKRRRVGVEFIDNGAGKTVNNCRADNNIVKMFDVGIVLPISDGGTANNNTISACDVGVIIRGNGDSPSVGNVIVHCKVALGASHEAFVSAIIINCSFLEGGKGGFIKLKNSSIIFEKEGVVRLFNLIIPDADKIKVAFSSRCLLSNYVDARKIFSGNSPIVRDLILQKRIDKESSFNNISGLSIETLAEGSAVLKINTNAFKQGCSTIAFHYG